MPLTGRRRLMLLSPPTEEALGDQAYEEILSQSIVLGAAHPLSRAVTRVGQQIQVAVDQPQMNWKFHVIESQEPNAFCLPGGKVFVHTGLFKIVDNEDALAAVLCHEAAHGLARHGAEKISYNLVALILLALIFPSVGQLSNVLVRLVIDLPFSRKLELEADRIGLRIMAKSCYDPRASIGVNLALGKLEQRGMLAHSKYFSTHPPSNERIESLECVEPCTREQSFFFLN
ncbi:TPA: hypothetical protein N0F65_009768 [Lagenidium giganteum]|uniref:Peptidase M48 domain-containing protein n=1 Tax=Lagenidium giganteum TaxID=4803 RepID=A0AAV2YTT2_9STRA|nr:TPA: hypothetical protein N0F65_009768 [Lagenidium giganteum]